VPGVTSFADLCHPTLARAPFTREGWIFELKHDGFRAFARAGAAPEFRSRWGRSLAEAFPEVVDALARLPDAALDGELIVPDREGRSDFEMLRRRSLTRRPREVARMSTTAAAVRVVFDVLEVRGRDMRAWRCRIAGIGCGPIFGPAPAYRSSSTCLRTTRRYSARSRRTSRRDCRQASGRALPWRAAVGVVEGQEQGVFAAGGGGVAGLMSKASEIAQCPFRGERNAMRRGDSVTRVTRVDKHFWDALPRIPVGFERTARADRKRARTYQGGGREPPR
jgi:hypothetical protein